MIAGYKNNSNICETCTLHYIHAEKYKYLYIISIMINCNSELENYNTYKAIQAEVTTVVNV